MGTWLSLFVVLVSIAALHRLVSAIQQHRKAKAHWTDGGFDARQLVFSEKLFRDASRGLVAKPDRGYGVGGVVTLVDLKTRSRHKVHRSDVVEISVQRVAVEADLGKQVSTIAYVVTETPDQTRKWHMVSLLSNDEVFAIKERRQRILDGRSIAHPTPRKGLCRHCAYQKECDDMERAQEAGC